MLEQTPEAKILLAQAERYARFSLRSQVGIEHMFLALLTTSEEVVNYTASIGVPLEQLPTWLIDPPVLSGPAGRLELTPALEKALRDANANGLALSPELKLLRGIIRDNYPSHAWDRLLGRLNPLIRKLTPRSDAGTLSQSTQRRIMRESRAAYQRAQSNTQPPGRAG